MHPHYSLIPYSDTGYFSPLVTAYLENHPNTTGLRAFAPTEAGISEAIAQRHAYPVNRQLLVSTLEKQYAAINATDITRKNIQSLLSEHTFTITTAHQPNLLTGYLYFIYKILHAIKLAEQLNSTNPTLHFVPVYYMGSEDNDLEELGRFRFGGEKYVWDGNGQQGAVGRMNTASLKPLLQQVFRLFGPPGPDCDALTDIITAAYLKHTTIGSATKYLVNALFGRYGLVIIDPDDAELKSAFVPVMEDELMNSAAHGIVTAQTALLENNYKAQAFPRPINLFYLTDGVRERIERHEDTWVVLNTTITFTKATLQQELYAHPERFSPNVVLRGLFQATILPDVVFIGGGAEVAYWLQLKTLFAHYKVFYPVVMLRQSVQWMHPQQVALRQKCGLSVTGMFRPLQQLEAEYVAANAGTDWQTSTEAASLELLFNSLAAKTASVDVTLAPAAAAALARMRKQLAVLETKMLRAEKKKMEVQLQRLQRLKESVFPNGSLQERTDNFADYYLQYGTSFFDIVKNGIDPTANMFLVIECPATLS